MVDVIKEAEKLAAVGVSFNVKFNDKIQMVVQTHFAQDDDTAAPLQKIFDQIDFHMARYEIVELEQELRRIKIMQDDQLIQVQTMQEAARKGQDGKAKYTDVESRSIAQAGLMLERHKNEEDRLLTQIEKRKAIVTAAPKVAHAA